MDSNIKDHIFINNIENRNNKFDNQLNSHRLQMQAGIANTELTNKYEYLNNYENQQIIKTKLIEWENQEDNDVNKIINLAKSNDRLEKYYGNFFINKLLNKNTDNYNLIRNIFDSNILKFYNLYLLEHNEPELQYIVILNLLYMSSEGDFILNSMQNKNMFIKLDEVLKHDIFKFKVAIVRIFSKICLSGREYSYNIYKLDFLNYIFCEISKHNLNDSSINSDYISYLTNGLLGILNTKELKENEITQIIKITKLLILNCKNNDTLLNCINSIPLVVDKFNNDTYNSRDFFVIINKFMYDNYNNIEYLKSCLILIKKFSCFDNLYVELIVNSGFRELVVNILQTDDYILNLLIYIIINNFISSSKKEFDIIMNIPGLFDLYCQHFYKENDKKWIKEILLYFLNFIKYIDNSNLNSLFNTSYFKIIFHLLNKDTNHNLLILLLNGINNLLRFDITLTDRPILKYINENNISDRIVELQEHPNDKVYALAIDMLESYFDVE